MCMCVCVCWCFYMRSNILVKDFLDAVLDTQILLGKIADVHTYIYIYLHVYVFVCVCACVSVANF